MKLAFYSIYHTDPPTIGISFDPTPALTLAELDELIAQLKVARKQLSEVKT